MLSLLRPFPWEVCSLLLLAKSEVSHAWANDERLALLGPHLGHPLLDQLLLLVSLCLDGLLLHLDMDGKRVILLAMHQRFMTLWVSC